MSITIIDGNIFTTKCQTLVNTVNCVGVMGAGIALECRLRYPKMNERYIMLCKEGRIKTGSLWIFKAEDRWILNFPTKFHWKNPSKLEYLHEGLKKFMCTYEKKGIESIAFPLLGAQNGGLNRNQSLNIMKSYLKACKIPVKIYRYDPMAPDDMYDKFRKLLIRMTPEEIKEETGLRLDYVQKLLNAINNPQICQLNRLASLKGIGTKTLEKAFLLARREVYGHKKPMQQKFNL